MGLLAASTLLAAGSDSGGVSVDPSWLVPMTETFVGLVVLLGLIWLTLAIAGRLSRSEPGHHQPDGVHGRIVAGVALVIFGITYALAATVLAIAGHPFGFGPLGIAGLCVDAALVFWGVRLVRHGRQEIAGALSPPGALDRVLLHDGSGSQAP